MKNKIDTDLIHVHYVAKIGCGCSYADESGHYHIYLDPALSFYEQKCTIEHELEHILHDDHAQYNAIVEDERHDW